MPEKERKIKERSGIGRGSTRAETGGRESAQVNAAKSEGETVAGIPGLTRQQANAARAYIEAENKATQMVRELRALRLQRTELYRSGWRDTDSQVQDANKKIDASESALEEFMGADRKSPFNRAQRQARKLLGDKFQAVRASL